MEVQKSYTNLSHQKIVRLQCNKFLVSKRHPPGRVVC